MTTDATTPGAPPVLDDGGLFEEYRRYGPLFRNLIRREIRQRYKGSMFGLLWTLVTPLVMVGTYSVVFHYVFRVINIPNYALFLVGGTAVWTMAVGGMLAATSSLVANANLVKKIKFPREIIPTVALLSNTVTAGFLLVIAVVLGQIYTVQSHLPLVALPVFVTFVLALALGFALVLSALNVYFRDVAFIFEALTLPWFFLTPIFYTFETLGTSQPPEWALNLLYYGNPMTPYVSAIRDLIFAGTWPRLADWLYCAGVGIAALLIGIVVFRRMEGEMAVVL